MSAFNLVKADLKRLKKDKPIRVLIIINLSFILLSTLLYLGIKLLLTSDFIGGALAESGMLYEEDAAVLEELKEAKAVLNSVFGLVNYTSAFSIGSVGIFIMIAVAMFIGKDYNYNTIRNKIISGNSRVKIYLSSYCISLIIGLVIFTITAAFTFLVTTAAFGFVSTNGVLLKAILLTIPIYVGIIAITCFISMSIKSLALGIVINLVVAYFLPNLLSFVVMLAPDSAIGRFMQYFPTGILSELLGLSGITVSTDISGLSTLPTLSTSIILRSIFVPIAYAAAFTTGGALIFKHTDIK